MSISARLDENEQILLYLFDRLQDAGAKERRLSYERTLTALARDQRIRLDLDAELAQLDADAPPDFEEEQIARIRTHYARLAPGERPATRRSGPAPKGLRSQRDVAKMARYRTEHPDCTHGEAKKALGFF